MRSVFFAVGTASRYRSAVCADRVAVRSAVIFAVFCLLVSVLSLSAATREITVRAYDHYWNDGWDGAALRVVVNGNKELPHMTVPVDSAVFTFDVEIGDEVSFYWIADRYDDECAFVVYYTDAPPMPFSSSSWDVFDPLDALLYRRSGDLKDVSTGTLLGSFTVTAPAITPQTVVVVDMRGMNEQGWSGTSALRISVNGTVLTPDAKLNFTNNNGTYSFYVNTNDKIEFVWLKGTFSNMCAFAVYYRNAPPATPFNPERWAPNDTTAILIYRQFETLNGVEDGTLLGSFTVGGSVSIATGNREVLWLRQNETAVVAPINTVKSELTAEPNIAGRQSGGAINFFWKGSSINEGMLFVYNAAGNAVKKISVNDNAVNNPAKRRIASWNLTDDRGRLVARGTYLLRGTVITRDGKNEKVSAMIGVW